jgi:uncharacterized phiE125 gp8 family phage protein
VRPARPGTIRWQLELVEPGDEPVSLDLAKAHLRVDIDDEDELIAHQVATAREYVEAQTGRALMTQTWKLWLDRFPRMDRVEFWPWASQVLGAILLPRPPVQSVTSIVWHGSDGSTHTVDPTTYVFDNKHAIPRVVTAFNSSWPDTTPLASIDGVEVTLVAGAVDRAHVPHMAIQAILLMLGHWYMNREEVVVDLRVKAIEVPKAAADLINILGPVQVG